MIWFNETRQAWIRETLFVFGYINCVHIERKFNVTTMIASDDLQRFMRENPGLMEYNATTKRYEALG